MILEVLLSLVSSASIGVISNIVSFYLDRKAKDTLNKYRYSLEQEHLHLIKLQNSVYEKLKTNISNNSINDAVYLSIFKQSLIDNPKTSIRDIDLENLYIYSKEYHKFIEEIGKEELKSKLNLGEIKPLDLELTARTIGEVDSYNLDLASKKKEMKKQASVIGLLLRRKQKEIIQASLTLSFITILFNILGFRFDEPVLFGNIFICFCFSLLIVYQLLLNYRIKNGLYGTNNYEAREIIGFIINNSDKFKDDSGKTLPIFPEEEAIDILFDTNSVLVRGYTNG